MNFKIWFLICLFFLVFNLKLLIDDYDLVNYMVVEKDDKLYDNLNKFLLCVRFESLKASNRMSYNVLEIKNVSASQFLNYSIRIMEDNLNTKNVFKLNETFIFYESVCVLTTKVELEKELPLKGFLTNYRLIRLFVYSKTKHPVYSEYIYDKRNRRSHFFNLKINRQKVYSEKYFSNPKCFNDEEKLGDRINCLNECFVRNKLQFGFYNYLDEGHFDLNLIIREKNNFGMKRSKRSLKSIKLSRSYRFVDKESYENFDECLKKCPEFFERFYENYNALKEVEHKYKTFTNKIIDIQTFIYTGYYSTSDFNLQLISLMILFTKTSVVSTLPFLVARLSKKIKIDNHKYFKLIFSKFKLILLLLSTIIILVQSLFMYKDYDFKSKYPNKTSFLNFSLEISNIVLCLPVEMIIEKDKKIKKNRNKQILKKYNFEELEERTNFKNQSLIERISLIYGSKEIHDFKWKVTDRVIFKNSSVIDVDFLSRCFRIEIEFKNLRYESLNPIYFLEIKFFNDIWEVYLLDKNRNVTYDFKELKEGYLISKIRKINLLKSKKSHCTDFKKLGINCETKKSCINRCLNSKFLRNHHSLPMYSVINKGEFEPDLQLNLYKFNDTRDHRLEEECEKRI